LVDSDLDLPSDAAVNLVPLLNLFHAIQYLGTKPHIVYFSSVLYARDHGVSNAARSIEHSSDNRGKQRLPPRQVRFAVKAASIERVKLTR